jgi:hypothetical protein
MPQGTECFVERGLYALQWYDAMNEGAGAGDRRGLIERCGRHRELHAAPDSPEDFWQLSFPSSQPQQEQQQKG